MKRRRVGILFRNRLECRSLNAPAYECECAGGAWAAEREKRRKERKACPYVRTWVQVEATLLGVVCPKNLSLVAVSSDQDMSPVAST